MKAIKANKNNNININVAMAQPIAQKTMVREDLGSNTSDGLDHGLSGNPHLPSFSSSPL